jgi:hypothetical protein
MMGRQSVRAVFTALAAVEGVERAEVRMGWLDLEHDGRVTLPQIAEALRVVGCTVVEERALPILDG